MLSSFFFFFLNLDVAYTFRKVFEGRLAGLGKVHICSASLLVFKTSQLHHHPGSPRKLRAEAERKRPPGQRKPNVPQQGDQTDGHRVAEALRLQKPLLFAQHLVPKCVFGYAGRAAPLSCEGPWQQITSRGGARTPADASPEVAQLAMKEREGK